MPESLPTGFPAAIVLAKPGRTLACQRGSRGGWEGWSRLIGRLSVPWGASG